MYASQEGGMDGKRKSHMRIIQLTIMHPEYIEGLQLKKMAANLKCPVSILTPFIISGRIPRRSAVGMNASPERSGGDNPDGSPISGRVFLLLEEYPAA